MPFADVDGLKTYYDSKGKGKPVLFVHGAGSDRRIWDNQLSGLSNRLRVIVLDLPGHGKSEQLEGRQTIERFADHVASFMKVIGLDKATLVGISMGGLVVQQLCLKHPELLEKLVVVNRAAKILVPQVALDLYRNQYEFAVKQLTPMSFSKKTVKANPVVVKLHVEQDLETDPKVGAQDYEAVSGVDFSAKLKNIKIPTLIIRGADDLLITQSMADFLHENIKGSKLEIIPDAGHVNMLEKPEHFNNVILMFIGS